MYLTSFYVSPVLLWIKLSNMQCISFQLRQKKKTVAKVVVSFSENKELFEVLVRSVLLG